MAQNNVTLYLMIISFLVLAFIYFILGMYCLKCIWKVFKSRNAHFLAKVFYIFMFLTCISLTTFLCLFLQQAIMAIKNTVNKDVDLQPFKNLLLETVYVPDALFWVVYLSLFWYLLILYNQGYMKTGDLIEGQKAFDPLRHLGKIKIIIYIYLLLQIIFVILQNYIGFVNDIPFIILDICINASIPLELVIAEMYLNIKFSGNIFQSTYYEKKALKFNKLVLFCAFMRVPQIALNVLILLYKETIFDFVNGTIQIQVYWQIFFIFFGIGDFLLATVIPFLTAMNSEFVNIFLLDFTNQLIIKGIKGHTTGNNDDDVQGRNSVVVEDNLSLSITNPQQKRGSQKQSDSYTEIQIQNIGFNDIMIDMDGQVIVFHQQFMIKILRRQDGLGFLRAGKLKGHKDIAFMFRQIELKQLSNYILEEVKNDIRVISTLNPKFVVQIHGFTTTKNQIILVYKHYPNGSLHTIFYRHQDQNNLSKFHSHHQSKSSQNQMMESKNQQFEFKIVLAIKIAESIEYLHSRSPPIAHGHLTPHNILLNTSYNIKISDLGMTVLKKYCSHLCSYTNKSQYSAPEVFQEKGNHVTKGTTEKDIYSFGMILYEIFTDSIPFDDLSKQQYQSKVEEDQTRPKITESVPPEIATLIRYCWQQNPIKRPTIQVVLEALNQFREISEQSDII